MILDKGHSKQYLEDWQDGLITQGLGISERVTDQHIRFKPSELNMILGLDNVGKTHWILWYFLVLSVQHNKKWTIWSGENSPSQSVKKLIEMLSGKHLNKLTKMQLYNFHDQIEQWFNFVSIDKMYDTKQMFDIFNSTDCDGCLIDPYTGLNRDYGHADNYKFLNDSRQFVNKSGKTMFVTTHPRTEAGIRLYGKGHDLDGFARPPLKAHTEGGQPFANRCDNFYILHRLTNHPVFRTKTELHVAKIKDTDTGGSITLSDEPVFFDYNNGLGFTINGNNPLLNRPQPKQEELKMKPGKEFEIKKSEPKKIITTFDVKEEVEADWFDEKEQNF